MNNKIKWQVSVLSNLTSKELLDISITRQSVFVLEQHRLYAEMDQIDEDPTTIHVVGYSNHHIVAYARIFRENEYISFGRVLTTKSYRRRGIGKELMDQVVKVIKNHYEPSTILIEAQVDKERFYSHYGLQSVSDKFLFNGTPHKKMQVNFNEIHAFI